MLTNEDLVKILNQRCGIAESRIKLMLEIKRNLLFIKSQGNYLENKDGVITIRDLIKWSNRKEFMINKEEIAYEGFSLLAERMRNKEEKKIIKNIIA